LFFKLCPAIWGVKTMVDGEHISIFAYEKNSINY
jgi:hypothetical protein